MNRPSEDELVAGVVDSLTAAERKALMYREDASEACMSWATAKSLHERGLTERNARFLRLTKAGREVRYALQRNSNDTE
jgi:hypothetical protein